MKKIIFILITVLVVGFFSSTVMATDQNVVQIIHGPYLLAAQENSIKIMWETNIPADSMVEYGLSDSYGEMVEATFRRGNPWEDISPEGICLYEAEITGLEPNTLYNYRVTTGSATSDNSTFKTLPGDEEPYKFIVIGDTHLFTIAEEFTNRALDYQPDFIVHVGDIPEGYGFQYDQFSKYWFTIGAEFLKQIPVFYAYGNHDVGCFWHDFFGTQATGLPNYGGTSSTPYPWFSFDVGNAHFIVLDSNEIFPVELEKMDEQFKWLVKDLESDAAKNATWRFIVQHHPSIGHEPVQKYIVPLMEEYDVDFLLAGHNHSFYKMISINPEIGAGNMFLNLGNGKTPGGNVNYGLRKGYPNLLAYGNSDYGTFEVNGDTIHIRVHTTLPEAGEGNTGILDEFVLVKEDPQLEYTDIEISPKSVKAGEPITIKATVKNTGRGLVTIALKVFDNGEPIMNYLIGPEGQQRVIALSPGETKEIEVSVPLFNYGKREIKVADFVPVVVQVEPLTPTFVYSDMTVDIGEGLSSDIITVTSMVQNIGSLTGTTEAKLYVDGLAVSSKLITLEPAEKMILTYFYKIDESGTHLVNVEYLEPLSLEIQGTLALTPIIPDLSSLGNHGIVRGDPEWVDGKVGKALDFDGKDDYVEIPDSESLHITDEFTAIVWGNVNWLDTEKNHSAALFGKGPSTGWGPTYLLRMIFRGTGGYTSGTCYDGIEFAWEGGWLNPEDIGTETWKQYISTFEKATSSGFSYINLEKVAESSGGGTPLNYWEGYPFLVGLHYAGNTDPIFKRGSMPFLLTGKVDEIRLYNIHLSEEERREIYENPEKLGPKSESLVIWLSFDEIENQGSYTTEWRKPMRFTPSYEGEKMPWNWNTFTANVSIAKRAGLEAIIQVSDNGEIIKDSKNVVLKDGINSYDISDLEQAQYIRIITNFDSTIEGTVIPIPKLHRYELNATRRGANTEIVWSTRADWEKGELNGAVGFEPVGRLDNL